MPAAHLRMCARSAASRLRWHAAPPSSQVVPPLTPSPAPLIAAANNLLAAAIDTRIFHERAQSDAALFKRLCPADKQVGGGTHHAPVCPPPLPPQT